MMGHPATIRIVRRDAFREGATRVFQRNFGSVVTAIYGTGKWLEQLVEARPGLTWAMYSLAYFAWAVFNSHRKQLWFDELVSYAVDHLPSWSAAWEALRLGVDANPPLFHAVNRGLLALVGDTPTGQRASSILGFWVCSRAVYLIARRSYSAAASWIAAVLPVCSVAAYFATESRPYGMVLGFVAIAALCWVQLADGGLSGRRRGWLLAGFGLSLAAAFSSHYFAIFAAGPFLGAEFTRAVKRRALDWQVLATIAPAFLPLGVYAGAGLMAGAGQFTGIAEPNSVYEFLEFWPYMLGHAAASLATAFALGSLWVWLNGPADAIEEDVPASSGLLLGVWFCLLPAAVAVAGRLITHAYEHRYAVTAMIGASLLAASAFDWLRRRAPGAAVIGLAALLLPLAGFTYANRNKPVGRHLSYDWVQAVVAQPDLAIVYSGQLELVQAWFNANDPAIKRRLLTLVDLEEGAKIHYVMGDLGVLRLKPALPELPIAEYKAYIAQRPSFYLIHQPAITNWTTSKLLRDGARLTLVGVYGGDELYRVDWNPLPPAATGETAPSPRPQP